MSYEDQTGERTEQPTPRRLQEARDEGRVPRSAELSAVVVLLGGCALLVVIGPWLLRQLTEMTAGLLRPDPAGWGLEATGSALVAGAGPTLWPIGLLLGGVCCAAAAAGVAQVGLRAIGERCAPDLGRLSAAAGLKRMFGRRGWVRGAMTLCKIAAVGGIAFAGLREALPRIAAVAEAGPGQIAAIAGGLFRELVARIGAALLVLAAADYLYQRWEHRQGLKMTRREWMEHLKEERPSPKIRRRHRALTASGAVERV